MPTLALLGGRYLGGAILDHFAEKGYDLAAISRSEETRIATGKRHPDALALTADLSKGDEMQRAAEAIRERFGTIDLAVNTISPVRAGVVTGGPLAEIGPDAADPYLQVLIPSVFHFFRVFGAMMVRQGSGCLIQVTGGSARRAMPRIGPWAAAAHATKALTFAAAQELRGQGVHAALMIVDALIDSPKTSAMTQGKPADASTTHEDVVRAIDYLSGQSPRGWSHELTITPAGDRWLP